MNTCPHCHEIQEERAAIHQFDGGATREQADALVRHLRCREHSSPASRLHRPYLPLAGVEEKSAAEVK